MDSARVRLLQTVRDFRFRVGICGILAGRGDRPRRRCFLLLGGTMCRLGSGDVRINVNVGGG
jgi:hypothetical protein